MSSKGKQQVVSSFGRELAAALEGSIAAGKDAAVQQAEKAAGEANAAAKEARDAVKLGRELSERTYNAVAAMLERHAKETRAVVGRGVILCSFLALLELVPFLLLLWAVFRE